MAQGKTRVEKSGYDCFKYHAPGPIGVQRIKDVRPEFGKLADLIEAQIPDCRERACALTALQEAMMYTTAAAVFTDPDAVATE